MSQLRPFQGDLLTTSAQFAPNLNIKRGQILALITAAVVTATYTLTLSGSPTAGTFRLTYRGNTSDPVAYSATASIFRENIRKGLIGMPAVVDGDFEVTGTGPFTITGAGALAGLPIETIGVTDIQITGGSIAAAAGVTGVAGGRYRDHSGAVLATPAANITTYSSVATTGTWLAGAISIQHTWETAGGETLPSPVSQLVMTATQSIRVAAINAAGTPDEAIAYNVYVNGSRVARIAVTTPGAAGNVVQTDITSPTFTGGDGKTVPTVNRAYTRTDGSGTADAIAIYDFRTDNKGQVVLATAENIVVPEVSGTVVKGGMLRVSELIGLTADALTQLGGRFFKGGIGIADSIIDIPYSR